MVLVVMVRKETIRKMADMHAPTTRRPADRDRAVDRIRRLTIGTTVAGIVAVGGFGGLAAATWHGTDSTVTTAAVIPNSDDDGTSTADDDASSTTSPAATSDTQATTPTVTTTGASAHATSGGS
jgi:hypothetical protein